MKFDSKTMEEQSVLQTAARMCAAARTAPKAKGIDRIDTIVLTGEDKDAVADRMEAIYEASAPANGFFKRDAGNVRASGAIVLIGTKEGCAGLNPCSFCGFENCGDCSAKGGSCAFDYINLGIAVSSAAVVAHNDFADNRIMFTIGRAWMDLNGDDMVWLGIPVSVTGKSKYFDR